MASSRRTFTSAESEPRTYGYEVESWVKDGEHPKRRMSIKDDDLPTVDFMTVKVISTDEPTDVSYITVWGPFPSWDFVEEILGYDYGDEGSRIYPRAA